MPKTLCSVCDSDDFENIDGFYYCNVCGTKSQGMVDIELSDDEVEHTGQKKLNKPSVSSKKTKEKSEDDKDISKNYSTFHVYNYLLKAQCDDLIKLGVDPVIEQVVLRLWAKYLQKLEIAFIKDKNNINKKNLKWNRDKKYFEIYDLNLEHEREMKEQQKSEKTSEISSQFFFSKEASRLNNINLNNDEENENLEIENENEEEEEYENEDVDNQPKNTLLVKFECIRMPHTVVILHLALLITQSPILISDLIRYLFNGKVSYFNINQVLPESYEFTYGDDQSMFNVISIPNASYLGYVSAKLAKFLDIGNIEIIPVKQVITRFLVDLNLPYELHEMVNYLTIKYQPMSELQIEEKARYESIEAIALSYIFVTILILFFYDIKTSMKKSNKDGGLFVFDEWLRVMQSSLENLNTNTFGKDLDSVRTVEDLETLKFKNFNHRHKLNTKKYYSQYRQKDLKEKLRISLEEDDENQMDYVMSESDYRTSSLFHITNPNWMKIKNMKEKSIKSYLTSEKVDLLSKQNFKSYEFRKFLKNNFQSKEERGKYLVGIETSDLDYLLEKFSQIAQLNSFIKMFNYVNKLINNLNF